MELLCFSRGGPCDGDPCPQNDPVWRPEPMQHEFLHNGFLKEEYN